MGHADEGSQYTSITFTVHLELEGIRPSGIVADASHNTLMETVIGLFKTKCIGTTVFQAGLYRTIADVKWATAVSIDEGSNRRLNSNLAYLAGDLPNKPTTQPPTENCNT